MNTWIDVKDKLPDIDISNQFGQSSYVLVLNMFGQIMSGWYQYDCEYQKERITKDAGFKIGWHASIPSYTREPLMCVTHWMPLPEGPE